MIHLDTGFLIRASTPGSSENARVRAWLKTGETLGLSAVARAEFLCGPLPAEVRKRWERIPFASAPLTDEEARLGARLFNETGRRRGSLPDCLIAATAIGAKAPIATTDARGFRRFEEHGLELADAD